MNLRPVLLALALSSAAFAAEQAATHALPPGIEWRQGNVEAAFAEAKASNKPLFLYWGAVWCPPCNQVKATIFNRQDFIARTRQFVPVFLDGDSPDAQKLASKFKVVGYPTMILFKPDGTEVTRLPGEVDGERYVRALSAALRTSRPVKALLASALKGDKLAEQDWQLLADYSWDGDEAQLVAADKLADTLQALASKSPVKTSYAATRLQLKALAIAAGRKQTIAFDKAATLAGIETLLADAKRVKGQSDIIANLAEPIIEQVTAEGAQRKQLAAKWEKALDTLTADPTFSTADRLDALSTKLALVRLQSGKDDLPAAVVANVRKTVDAADKKTTNGYERQAVIASAGHLLTDAGLVKESDTLLLAELKKSHSPYYHMQILASNAKLRGDKVGALDWYGKAYDASVGEATRLQWGSNYVGNIVELAPQDEARVEKASLAVVADAEKAKSAFYERSQRSMKKLVDKLRGWSKDGQHEAVVKRVLVKLGDVCTRLPANDPQRASCEGLLKKPQA
ncbi:thioredoxin family protein [Burkholderiaceae bacterium DAT-1]|nr:thioredoxin family protein [Burkholderiaceae bacterium DAT-1]